MANWSGAEVIPPDEMPDDEYPMILTTGRQLEHWHTGALTRRASVLDALEPEAVAQLNYRDLKRLGVEPGDMVRVATRRGIIELKARRPSRAGRCAFIAVLLRGSAREFPDESAAGSLW